MTISPFQPTDNPLHCSCDSQELWEWLKVHQKWISVADGNRSYLKCEHPVNLRGRIFTQMEPHDFCGLSLIAKLAIQDIQPYSVVVSWQKREHSGLHGFEVKYQQVDPVIEDVSTETNNSKIRILFLSIVWSLIQMDSNECSFR